MPTENRKTGTAEVRRLVTNLRPAASNLDATSLAAKTQAGAVTPSELSLPIVRQFRELLRLEADLQAYEGLIYTIANSRPGDLPVRKESLDRARARLARIGEDGPIRRLEMRLREVTSERERVSEEQAAVLLANLLGGIPDFGASPAEKEARLEALIVTIVHSSDQADYERCVIDQPISAEVLAIAVRILWRDATREKALPFPGDVLKVCRNVRARVIHAYRMLQRAVDLRDNSELVVLEFGSAAEREALCPGYDEIGDSDVPF
jgi:hypothetical protein